jgi:CRP-like cAMP-binding protein
MGYTEVFAFLDVEEQKRLASLVSEVSIAEGAFLFEVDDQAAEVFFLVRGRLSVLKKTGFHRKMQIVAILEPGAIVGEAGLLADHIHKTSIRGIEDAQLFCLKRQDIEALEHTDPQLVMQLLKRLLQVSSLRLEKTAERLTKVL